MLDNQQPHWKDNLYYEQDFCPHYGEKVKVGKYQIFAGGSLYLNSKDIKKFDLLIPLARFVPVKIGQRTQVLGCPWIDLKRPPKGFREFLIQHVIPELDKGTRILVYCEGGHGRTGTFLAALIALLESDVHDPIAEVRNRYCQNAVETLEQAEAIFALREEELPKKYVEEFPLISKLGFPPFLP